MYDQFKQFLNDKEYEYETDTEKAINELIDDAESEKYFSDIEQELDQLKDKMNASKENDIERFKSEIMEVMKWKLLPDIVIKRKNRIYHKHDKDLAEAIDLLNDMERYHAIIRGDSIN